MPAPRTAVYTAVIGGYEALREEPLATTSAADFICLTDDPELRSDTWELVVVAPRFATDPVRSARHVKICGHPRLDGYEQTLWIDNAVGLLADPMSFVGDWLADAEVAAPLHAHHRTVLAEAEGVIDLGKDDHTRVYEQLAHYARTDPAVLEANPHWTALLARRRTPEVAAAMQLWWEHVLRFSRRDQLSFSVTMAAAGIRLRSVELADRESALHHWPAAEGRIERDGDRLREALRPPVARLATLEHDRDLMRLAAEEAGVERNQLAGEVEKLQRDAAASDARTAELEAALVEAGDRVRRLRGRLDRQRARAEELQARLARETRARRRWWQPS